MPPVQPDSPRSPLRPGTGRAVGPRLRKLLYAVFALLAAIAVNSAYMTSITFVEWCSLRWGAARSYQDHFYLSMFATHLVLGLLLIAPFLAFGILHLLAARNRRNRRAVRIGYALFAIGLMILLSGLLLVRIEGFLELNDATLRSWVYWAHVLGPLLAIWLYWLHRLVGPRIRWSITRAYGVVAALVVVVMVLWQTHDPRRGPTRELAEGSDYFRPSLVRTENGQLIPSESLMMDDYCKTCHEDAYQGWFHSVHHFSSFNNPPYRATVRDTREKILKRDGDVQATRFCAACHDPVPFLSGAFDDPDFDDIDDPTASAGITCTVCHAITQINSTEGNGAYTIGEPMHYPFAYSKNSWLQYVNRQLIRAKPAFHKRMFLKPLHRSAEFCSVCHKVHLPKELTDYKEFLRGQNHYDSWLLSGVSGHGARSFYYPERAETNCNGCHMPLVESNDFGASRFDDSGETKIHDHLFPSANTAMAWLRDEDDVIRAHQRFLEGVMRVDIFGIKEDASIDRPVVAPLRPDVPTLRPGGKYLLETVIRTATMGHAFTQGTTDSNEIWMDVTVSCGEQVIGRSGQMDPRGGVDPAAYFVNVFMLDREGQRIDRRNAEDIFVPLYDHQIPPGAARVVHYGFALPERLDGPITIEVKLQYRKFDQTYMQFVADTLRPGDPPLRGLTSGEDEILATEPAEGGSLAEGGFSNEGQIATDDDQSAAEDGSPAARPAESPRRSDYVNRLPVTTLAVDRIVFPVSGVAVAADNPVPDPASWQRWNDYGIGLLLEGSVGTARGELRQAAQAFHEVERLHQFHGPLNLARVYFIEGRLDEAVAAANRAAADPAAPQWTIAWLSGLINKQQGFLDRAIGNFRSVLEDRTEAMHARQFDFGRDYEVINELGLTLFERAKQFRGPSRQEPRDRLLREAVEQFQRTLGIDSENVAAHYNLGLLYTRLGDRDAAKHHQQLHARYKPDDNARDRAIAQARQRYPEANRAAEPLVIYWLNQAPAPGVPAPDASIAPREPE